MKQFDLFLDSQSVRARNALHDALAQADANEAKRAHDELSVLEPSHRWLPRASTLIEALETPLPTDAGGGLAVLARLDADWTEAADGIFGAGEHDPPIPFWRAVGHVLAGATFEPEHPDLHASHAWMKSGEWASAQRCIRDVPGYRTQPALLARMAQAIWRQQRWAGVADHWFALCWLAPEECRQLMECGDIRDRPDAEIGRQAGRPRPFQKSRVRMVGGCPGEAERWVRCWTCGFCGVSRVSALQRARLQSMSARSAWMPGRSPGKPVRASPMRALRPGGHCHGRRMDCVRVRARADTAPKARDMPAGGGVAAPRRPGS